MWTHRQPLLKHDRVPQGILIPCLQAPHFRRRVCFPLFRLIGAHPIMPVLTTSFSPWKRSLHLRIRSRSSRWLSSSMSLLSCSSLCTTDFVTEGCIRWKVEAQISSGSCLLLVERTYDFEADLTWPRTGVDQSLNDSPAVEAAGGWVCRLRSRLGACWRGLGSFCRTGEMNRLV